MKPAMPEPWMHVAISFHPQMIEDEIVYDSLCTISKHRDENDGVIKFKALITI